MRTQFHYRVFEITFLSEVSKGAVENYTVLIYVPDLMPEYLVDKI